MMCLKDQGNKEPNFIEYDCLQNPNTSSLSRQQSHYEKAVAPSPVAS